MSPIDSISRRHFSSLGLAGAAFAAAPTALAASLLKDTRPVTQPTPIYEGRFVPINGLDQWVTIRGRDRTNPVLLLLHGGPGFPMSGLAPIFSSWEEHYTVVQWDQPGGGATYAHAGAEAQGSLTVERFVRDGIAVSEFARGHLGVPKIALMGVSWGTMLGSIMVHQRPDMFSAYVGTAQAVSGPRGGRLGYDLGLAAARQRGDAAAVAALTRVGPPPYARFEDFLVRQQYTNPPGLPASAAEQAASAALGPLFAAPLADTSYVAQGLGPYNGEAVFLATQRQTWQETAAWDIASLGRRFEVPVFVIQGGDDLNTPVALARDWVAHIHAPAKAFEVIEGCTHSTIPFHDRLLAFLQAHMH